MKNGLIFAVLTAIFFATLEPVSKLIARAMSPYSITAVRFLIGSALLLPFGIIRLKQNKSRLKAKEVLMYAVLGSVCILSMIILQFSVKIADSAALCAVIFCSNSVFTIVFAALILKEKLTVYKVIGALICFIGVIVCADLGGGSGLLAAGLALLSAVLFSLYTVLSKKLMTQNFGLISTSVSFFLGSLIWTIGMIIGGVPVFEGIELSNLWVLLYLGVFVTGVGYWAYFEAVKRGGAMTASYAFFIKPVIAPFMVFLINGTKIGVNVFIAVLMVVIGSYLASKKQKN